MSAPNAVGSNDSINGLRTLELGSALLLLRKQFIQHLGPGAHSISLSGARTLKEQESLGMSQILQVMFPFAIELALKSLRDCFHQPGTHGRRHNLDVLFQSLHEDAADENAARQAQLQARDLWLDFQRNGQVHYRGTLDQFLTTHARDFVETRYYTPKPAEFLQINDFSVCFHCIIYALAARDKETFSNLLSGSPLSNPNSR